jgi:hypothetical protein
MMGQHRSANGSAECGMFMHAHMWSRMIDLRKPDRPCAGWRIDCDDAQSTASQELAAAAARSSPARIRRTAWNNVYLARYRDE